MSAREPDEILYDRDLTHRVGAAADYAFRRSVKNDDGNLKAAVMNHAPRISEWPTFVRELFATLYDEDGMTPLPEDKVSEFGRRVIRTLKAQPQFDALMIASAVHRTIAAEAAAGLSHACGVALNLGRLQPREKSRRDPRDVGEGIDAAIEMLKDAGASDKDIGKVADSGRREEVKSEALRKSLLAKMDKEVTDNAAQFSAAISAVVEKAEAKARAMTALRGFGIGGSSATGDDGVSEELLAMLAANPSLLRVLEQCGRLRQSASAEGMAEVTQGSCNIVGVEPSDDVTRLLPEELALLDDDVLGDYQLSRLFESGLLSWEMKGQEKRNRGDIVLVVDRSGSMSGITIVFARAIAAACLLNAIRDGRRVVLVMFGSGTPDRVVVNGKADLANAVKALGLPASGGTDVTTAMRSARTAVDDLRDPDVLLITDGIFPCSTTLQDELKLWPDGPRFLGVLLNNPSVSLTKTGHDWIDDEWSVRVTDDPASDSTAIDMVDDLRSRGGSK